MKQNMCEQSKLIKSAMIGALQPLKTSQLDWASQTRIFTVMISSLVARLLAENSSTIVVDTLVRLGKRHHELGVRPKHYTSMQVGVLVATPPSLTRPSYVYSAP